jgi:hypothetical protein
MVPEGQETASAAEYIARVRPRLEAEGFVWIDAPIRDTRSYLAAAKRRRFELTKFGMSTTFFVFERFDRVDTPSLRSFAESAFEFGTRNRGGLLPRGLGEGVFCFAVAVGDGAEEDAIRWVRDEAPPKRWAGAMIPAIVLPASGEVYYLQKTPMWGAAYWKGLRGMAQRILTLS